MIRSGWRRRAWASLTGHRLRLLHAAVFLGALALTLIAWWPAHDGWFLLDDHRWLPPERRRFDLLKSLIGPWGHSFAYRPLVRLSFFADLQLFGLDPRGWHLHSFVLHAANATLLFSLVRVTTDVWAAALGIAALFTVSPLAHENVAWISGRTFLLGGGFFLLSANLLVRSLRTTGEAGPGRDRGPSGQDGHDEQDGQNERGGHSEQGARGETLFRWGAASFVAAMASYEAAVVLPLVAFVAIRLFPSLAVVPADVVRRRLRQLFVILIVFMACRFVFLKFRLGGVNITSSLWLYEPIRWWFGVWIRGGDTIRIAALAGLTVAFAMSCALLWRWPSLAPRAARRVPLFLVVTAFLLFLPFINVVGIADRFFYLVQVTFIATIVFPLWLVARAARAGAFLAAVVLSVLVIGGVVESRRAARDWAGAGLIARSVADEMQRLHPTWSAGVDVVLDGVPRAVGRTPVYVLYAADSVLQRYTTGLSGGGPDGKELTGTGLDGQELSGRRLNGQPLNGQRLDADVYFGDDLASSPELQARRAARPARYFRFDAQTRRLSELSASEWENAHARGR